MPLAREIMASPAGVPSDIRKKMEEFPFDFSEFDKFEDLDTWIVETLYEKEKRDMLNEVKKGLETEGDLSRGERFSLEITKKIR